MPSQKYVPQISLAKLLTSAAIILVTIIFFLLLIFSGSGLLRSKVFVVLLLTFGLLLTRLSILAKVGIGFVNIILFSTQLAFGVLPALFMIIVTSAIYLSIATRPTPIDFMITKGVQSAIAQTVYFSLWVLTMVPYIHILGTSFIVSHLTATYIIAVLIYIFYMIIFLPIIAREPLPMTLINGMIMIPMQLLIVKLFGHSLVTFLLGL